MRRFVFFFSKIKSSYYQESSLVLAILLLGLLFYLLTDSFLTVSNLLNILQQITIIAILGFGVTLVIISGGIDLSLGAVLALSGMVTAALLQQNLSIFLSIAAGVLSGAVLGLVNGVNVVFLRLPAFIATLAMLSIARGVALVATRAVPIYDLPESFLFLGTGFLFGIPVPVFCMLSLLLVLQFCVTRMRWGRYIYAIGGNEEAARLSGIRVSPMKLGIYTLCGICSGLAGVLFAARLGSGQPTVGIGYELDAITAAILGGTNLFGGAGTLIGTLFGAFAMGIINNGQALLNVNSYVQLIIKGIIVILAVGMSTIKFRAKGNKS